MIYPNGFLQKINKQLKPISTRIIYRNLTWIKHSHYMKKKRGKPNSSSLVSLRIRD